MVEKRLTILDFDRGYLAQDFYKDRKFCWLDATGISGVNGYCDSRAEKALAVLLEGTMPGLCFLGSGNYHYVSHLLLAQVRQPFVLVLLDHHSDMQESMFGDLLSCGSWVKRTLDTNPWLKRVILIGASQTAVSQIPQEYLDRMCCLPVPGQDAQPDRAGLGSAGGEQPGMPGWEPPLDRLREYLRDLGLPVYLSIDKDVFCPEEVSTDWDQGAMTIGQLAGILALFSRECPLLGADVCGEIRPGISGESQWEEKSARNGRANDRILAMLEPFVL